MASASSFDENYQSVAERIKIFREKHPEGSLRPLNPEQPFQIVEVGEQTFIAVVAAAYRHPADPAPGVGSAWCPLPGNTEYTLWSEIQNAETSAWGRAIIATLAADSTKIASKEEVRSAESHRSNPAGLEPVRVSGSSAPTAASASGTSVKPTVAPTSTDPAQEEYNAAVIEESLRLLNDPSTDYAALRDVWSVLSQGGLSARRIEAPAGMEPDGDGLVPIAAAVAFVGKQRKEAAEAAAKEPPPEVEDPPAPRRARKAAAVSE